MAIEWDEVIFGTGNQEIDAQHRGLFEQLDKLIESIRSGAEVEVLTDTVAFLEHYANEHFRYEETIMGSLRYERLVQHRTAHGTFRANVKRIRNEIESGGADGDLAVTVYRDLCDWLIKHIRTEDRKALAAGAT